MNTTATAVAPDARRVQFLMSPKRLEIFDKLAGELNISRTEFLNNALSFLTWAIRETKRGRMIASVDENEKKFSEVQLPLLSELYEAARLAHEAPKVTEQI